ncbi:hypothetical protein PENANT_c042G11670 [Penicillium antarcticum]|uniref:O-methyltransferase domain-containing protein n=1 Tax=Penicillium antarcticum TaxID=416450 RepID=A0A1V6PS74_9EURO|nr:uncharacterized protein N7508_004608 [Penicillium antarcticum]KAJ5309229.1 hypothetical protein N7508_004608 [Penicillium antarcticum]OQD79879.1 hypothetical protein PENANT_c042G11670 [Penicillium antarcticum]
MSSPSNSRHEVVDSYVATHLITPNKALEHAVENSTKRGLPMIAVSPVQGKFTSLLASLSSTRNLLEIGTLGGYSTIWFAQALKGQGKVTSIEIDQSRRDIAVENLQFGGFKPKDVDVILGAGLDVLPRLANEIKQGKREPFDFIFIDADWENQWNYFDFGVKLSAGKGSVVYVDNAVRNLVESDIDQSGSLESGKDGLVAKVGRDDRVDAVVMQTVGGKDYDGFLLAVVK